MKVIKRYNGYSQRAKEFDNNAVYFNLSDETMDKENKLILLLSWIPFMSEMTIYNKKIECVVFGAEYMIESEELSNIVIHSCLID